MSNTIVKLKETINNVTNDVIQGMKVNTTIADQEINVFCDDIVYAEAVRLCDLKVNEYKLANNIIPDKEQLKQIKKKIPVCMACSANEVSQNATVIIDIKNIENNVISNKIQDGLTNKLSEEITYLTNKDKSKADSMTVIRDVVKNNFNTELVTNTIRNFSFQQTINLTNIQAKKINQTVIATIVSDIIINNFIANSTAFNNAIKVLDGDQPIVEPALQPIVQPEVVKPDYSFYFYIFIILICFMLYMHFSKRKLRRKQQRRHY